MHGGHAEIKSKFSVKTEVYFFVILEIRIDLVFNGAGLLWSDQKLSF